MRHRLLTATLSTLALAALAPASAGASPMPDPSPRTSAAVTMADTLYQVQDVYRKSPVKQSFASTTRSSSWSTPVTQPCRTVTSSQAPACRLI